MYASRMDNPKVVELLKQALALLESQEPGESTETTEPGADDAMSRMTKPPMRG